MDAARHRRDPGQRDPGHAAAPAGRPGAAEDHRRARRADGQDRRLQRDPRLARAAARRSSARSCSRDRRQVRRRAAHRDRALRRRHVHRGPDRRRGHRRHRSPAAATPSAPRPTCTARRSAAARACAARSCKQDDIVDHFFVTTTHHWLLFFTNKGRVYRAKAYELPGRRPRRPRPARRQPAGLPAGRADRPGPGPARLRGRALPVLATKTGLVKKTALTDYDSPRSGGVIAINLREDDELIAARLVAAEDDLLLVSAKAQAIRFRATDESLRPDGPGHLGRHRDAFRGRRRTARHVRGPGRRGCFGGHRRRLRKTDTRPISIL